MENAVKIAPAAMGLHNFCIDNDGGNKGREDKERLVGRLRAVEICLKWVRTGDDPDDCMDIALEPLSSSAKRAEKKLDVIRKVVLWPRRKARLRPEAQVE